MIYWCKNAKHQSLKRACIAAHVTEKLQKYLKVQYVIQYLSRRKSYWRKSWTVVLVMRLFGTWERVNI